MSRILGMIDRLVQAIIGPGAILKKKQISDIDLQDLEQRMSPILLVVANSLFEGDYETFQKHHDPIVPEEQFQQTASALKPMGKPVDAKYLGHLIKAEGVKLLWRVTYSDSKEELLWQFNIELEGIGERIESMGIS